MRVLAIGAHADDIELGCGASLMKWAEAGHEVVIYVATRSGYAAPDGTVIRSDQDACAEAEAAAAVLGAQLEIGPFATFGLSFGEALNTTLVAQVDRIRPDMVLTHWDGDTHPDHAALARSTLHACRRVPTVLCYASNWYVGSRAFDPRMFVDVSGRIEAKIDLVALHRSEMARTQGVWGAWLREEAARWGRVAGVAEAEAFEVVKQLYR